MVEAKKLMGKGGEERLRAAVRREREFFLSVDGVLLVGGVGGYGVVFFPSHNKYLFDFEKKRTKKDSNLNRLCARKQQQQQQQQEEHQQNSQIFEQTNSSKRFLVLVLVFFFFSFFFVFFSCVLVFFC